jgi:hypothetical protein
MKSEFGHLSYCTNIHSGENWDEHFIELKKNFSIIKKNVSPNDPLGIGLRLSNQASITLTNPEKLKQFEDWLNQEEAYVFTMNGFPYGDFHSKTVKEAVHAPDWTRDDRIFYTIRLFDILEKLLPSGMEGGISTSPLGYRHHYDTDIKKAKAIRLATENVIKVAEHLMLIKESTGKSLHLDIEPEPDGLLETGEEFIDWYEGSLLPLAKKHFSKEFKLSELEIERLIKEHVQLCYDICHFALGYENHEKVINTLEDKDIRIGKIQISAALKAQLADENKRNHIASLFKPFDENIYLHQVIAQQGDGSLIRYKDLPDALKDIQNKNVNEWRAHFHVPIFLKQYGDLESTQNEIIEVLNRHKNKSISFHLEVETYTWGVLPSEFQIPIVESIERELLWVNDVLSN